MHQIIASHRGCTGSVLSSDWPLALGQILAFFFRDFLLCLVWIFFFFSLFCFLLFALFLMGSTLYLISGGIRWIKIGAERGPASGDSVGKYIIGIRQLSGPCSYIMTMGAKSMHSYLGRSSRSKLRHISSHIHLVPRCTVALWIIIEYSNRQSIYRTSRVNLIPSYVRNISRQVWYWLSCWA